MHSFHQVSGLCTAPFVVFVRLSPFVIAYAHVHIGHNVPHTSNPEAK